VKIQRYSVLLQIKMSFHLDLFLNLNICLTIITDDGVFVCLHVTLTLTHYSTHEEVELQEVSEGAGERESGGFACEVFDLAVEEMMERVFRKMKGMMECEVM
jgi:hypothetical protein